MKIEFCFTVTKRGEAKYVYTQHRGSFTCGNAINISYSKCVSVALFIQHEKRKHNIILSTVACLRVPYFFNIISQTARFSGEGY